MQAIKLIKERSIPIEMNITSNDYLVELICHPIKEFVDQGFTLTLGTDDDGIWKCEYSFAAKRFTSVAAEYARALQKHRLIDNPLSQQEVVKIIDSSITACFGNVVEEKLVHFPSLNPYLVDGFLETRAQSSDQGNQAIIFT